MLYILETNLQDSKPIYITLTKIYGIGKATSFIICKKLGFSLNLKTKDLTQDQIVGLIKLIDSLDLIYNNDLKKLKSLAIKNLVSIKSYRGLRRLKGFPVRGQRTHTNAKTSKRTKRFS